MIKWHSIFVALYHFTILIAYSKDLNIPYCRSFYPAAVGLYFSISSYDRSVYSLRVNWGVSRLALVIPESLAYCKRFPHEFYDFVMFVDGTLRRLWNDSLLLDKVLEWLTCSHITQIFQGFRNLLILSQIFTIWQFQHLFSVLFLWKSGILA